MIRVGNGVETELSIPASVRDSGTVTLTGGSRNVTTTLRNGGVVGRVCMGNGLIGVITGW